MRNKNCRYYHPPWHFNSTGRRSSQADIDTDEIINESTDDQDLENEHKDNNDENYYNDGDSNNEENYYNDFEPDTSSIPHSNISSLSQGLLNIL